MAVMRIAVAVVVAMTCAEAALQQPPRDGRPLQQTPSALLTQAHEHYKAQQWERAGATHQSAFDSQALLNLKKNYCNEKRCLQCAIGNSILMGSDTHPRYGDVGFGDNFSVSINAESREEADKIFNGLSAGGKVEMPMNDTFWGSYFGMFKDKFGINWMVSFDKNEGMK